MQISKEQAEELISGKSIELTFSPFDDQIGPKRTYVFLENVPYPVDVVKRTMPANSKNIVYQLRAKGVN
ncbi:MAG: hypothetical protein V4486_01850 [Patescibacteria group bacterium]